MDSNLRLIVTESPTIGGEMQHYFDVHQVYYKDGIPNYIDKKPIQVSGNSINEINIVLCEVDRALNKPILWGDNRFPQEFKKE